MILDSGQDKSLEYYKAWAPYLGEKAYSINKTWTLSNVRVSPTSTCVKQGEGLQGIVATNASAYDAAAPTYDSTSGTLDYHVAADRKSTRLNSSHIPLSRMPSSA